MNQDEMKKQAAIAALDYLPNSGIIGVGTGSTVNHFIDALAPLKGRFEGAASSSETSCCSASISSPSPVARSSSNRR